MTSVCKNFNCVGLQLINSNTHTHDKQPCSILVTSGSLRIWLYPKAKYKSQEAEIHILLSSLLGANACTYMGRNAHTLTHSQAPKFSRSRGCVFGLHTHKKRMIPVLDIAKANPRIPLPIMALLRLKMDMPNEVFPSNCNKRTGEDVTQTTHQQHRWHWVSFHDSKSI